MMLGATKYIDKLDDVWLSSDLGDDLNLGGSDNSSSQNTNTCGGLADWEGFDYNISSATIIERTATGNHDAEYYTYDAAGQRTRKVKETFESSETVKRIEEKIYLGGVEIKRIKTVDVATSVETQILDRSDLHIMDDKQRIAIINHWTRDDLLTEIENTTWLNSNRQRYQYSNHLGSASLELNTTGDLISYEEYYPYGGTSFTTGANATEVKLKEYRYTGKERDDSTGLYYYGARYYAPWVCRWMSADPAGPVDGLNLYQYTKSNPILFVDISGKQSYGSVKLGFELFAPKKEPKDVPEVDISKLPEKEKLEKLEKLDVLREIKEGGKHIHKITSTYKYGWKSDKIKEGKLQIKVHFKLTIKAHEGEKIIYFRDPSSESAIGVGPTIREHERAHAEVFRDIYKKEHVAKTVEHLSKKMGLTNPQDFFSFTLDVDPKADDERIGFLATQEIEERQHAVLSTLEKEHQEKQAKEVHLEDHSVESSQADSVIRLGEVTIQGKVRGGFILEYSDIVSSQTKTKDDLSNTASP